MEKESILSFNGSGVFVRLYNWADDKAAGIKVRADRMDAEMDGMATGLSTCITKDGQTTITANLPMAGYRHTGVGNGSARTDYAALGQVQNSDFNWAVGGGTVDAITATYSPAITTLVDGQVCYVETSGTNTSTTPTFSPNGLTARTIVKGSGQALDKGDIPFQAALRYDLANTRWFLLNPIFERFSSGASGETALAHTNTKVLLSAVSMNTTNKYTPLLAFGSTDADFTTTNPKIGAFIVGEATSSYTGDATSGMSLHLGTCDTGQATPTLNIGMTIDNDSNVFTANGKIGANATQQHTLPAVTSDTFTLNAATQTLTNKSLSDSTTFLIDNSDATKKAQFQLSGITTATTRTYTFPDVSGTLLTTANLPSALSTASGSAPSYSARAFVSFNGTGTPAIRGTAANVTSITDNGTGDYTINFTTALPDANYTIVVTSGSTGTTSGNILRQVVSRSTTALRIVVGTTAGATDLEDVNVVIFSV